MNAIYRKVPVAKPCRIALTSVISTESPSLVTRLVPIPPPMGLATQKMTMSSKLVFRGTCTVTRFIPSEKASSVLWMITAMNT